MYVCRDTLEKIHENPNLDQNIQKGVNRGWLEIIYEILLICVKRSLKTRVMYSCNLNSQQVKRYLQFLQNQNLIKKYPEEQKVKRPKFQTTSLGEKYIKAYDDLMKLFEHKWKN